MSTDHTHAWTALRSQPPSWLCRCCGTTTHTPPTRVSLNGPTDDPRADARVALDDLSAALRRIPVPKGQGTKYDTVHGVCAQMIGLIRTTVDRL